MIAAKRGRSDAEPRPDIRRAGAGRRTRRPQPSEGYAVAHPYPSDPTDRLGQDVRPVVVAVVVAATTTVLVVTAVAARVVTVTAALVVGGWFRGR